MSNAAVDVMKLAYEAARTGLLVILRLRPQCSALFLGVVGVLFGIAFKTGGNEKIFLWC